MHDDEELTSKAEDCESTIKLAMAELDSVAEYKEIYDMLDETLDKLREVAQIYKDKYADECEENRAYENLEYERSKI